jgi:hypothetical protein
MRRTQRLIAACVLMAFSGALGGCSSGGFDPSDLLDFLDTKKKLPGDRKPVFPDGVPGLEQGVPRELYKGAQQQPDQPGAQAEATAAPPPPEPPASKQAAKSKKGKPAASVAAAPAAAPDADAVPEEDTTPAAPPAPKPKKIARKRTTAPPPDDGQPAQQGAPFPAPVPSGTFTR